MKRCIVLCSLLIVITVLSGCGETAETADLAQSKSTLYILMYHNFVPDGQECNDFTTSESHFRRDLQWLTEQGYSFVLPSELAAGEPLPEKAVMLTFDDGYSSNYEIAYPLLQEYDAKAVIALITKRIEDEVSGFLTWDMCREMLQSGIVEIGSHSHDVHILADQGVARNEGESREDYEARVFPDIQTSIALIQQELGITPVYFAYPYGKTEEWIADYIQEHFTVTVTTAWGAADTSGGLYNLPRYNIHDQSDLSSFMP